MRATLFLADKNVVDGAIILDDGSIQGLSFAPYYEVTGDVTDDEQVVIDFSKCKKLIKSFLDDPEQGMDHKLWIYPNSKAEITRYTTDREYCVIDTPKLKITVPSCRIHWVESLAPQSYDVGNAGLWIQAYLNRRIREVYPQVTIQCFNDTTFQVFPSRDESAVWGLTYNHGLKNSSSWGCKSPVHGHLSFLQLIFAENIIDETDGCVIISYTDPDGCLYQVVYYDRESLLILPTETTIENIASFLAQKYSTALIQAGCTQMWISEGLCKGATVHF